LVFGGGFGGVLHSFHIINCEEQRAKRKGREKAEWMGKQTSVVTVWRNYRIATDTAAATKERGRGEARPSRTTREALSLHPVECLLENLDVDRIPHFFASLVDPLFLERVLGGTIGFVEDAEDAGERQLRQFVGGELVGDVVTEFVLGSVVPFLFLD